MGEDLISNLPSDVILNILSRLDAGTAVRGKCVCKPWLDLLTTPEFAKSHLSKSVPGLIVVRRKLKSQTHKMVDFVDELDWRLNPAFNLDLPFQAPIHSSVNGLILLRDGRGYGVRTLCNPLTREYITLPCPGRPSSKIPWEIYGFGVSRMSGQYKVVRIFSEKRQVPIHLNSSELECQVFTIGSGSWRRIANCIRSVHNLGNWRMTFCNGNLHWWTSEDALAPRQISCLDLETELFSTFSDPPCA